MKRSFSPEDLPMVNGWIYHLDLASEELAQNVVVVCRTLKSLDS